MTVTVGVMALVTVIDSEPVVAFPAEVPKDVAEEPVREAPETEPVRVEDLVGSVLPGGRGMVSVGKETVKLRPPLVKVEKGRLGHSLKDWVEE